MSNNTAFINYNNNSNSTPVSLYFELLSTETSSSKCIISAGFFWQ